METITVTELKEYEPFYCSSCVGLHFRYDEVSELVCSLCGKNGVSFTGKTRIDTEMMINCQKCSKQVSLCTLSEHLNRECDGNSVSCKFCQTIYPFYKEKEHLDRCEKVSVECQECFSVMNQMILPIHKQYYCSFSPTCVKILCQICKESVNVTTFQTHYETHLYRDKSNIKQKRKRYIFNV